MNPPDFGAAKQRPFARCPAAFTLIENLFAIGIVGLFFIALYALNSQCVYMLSSGRGAAIAEQSSQDRLEQLRNCTWAQLTDASYLRDNVLNASTTVARSLGSLTETLTVNAYPIAVSPAICGAIIAKTLNGNGNTTWHYDETLAGAGAPTDYKRAVWVEDER